jgi:Clp amino terminal domain, pathogenicity island component
MVAAMAPALLTLESLIDQVNGDRGSDPVLDRLERAVELAERLGELSENLVGYFVDESRRAGMSWSEIGGHLGVSRQAAQKRFVTADGESDRFWDRTSQGFKSVIDGAEAAAQARNQGFLGTEHVLLALSERPRDPATAVLVSVGIDPKVLRGAVDGRIGAPLEVRADVGTPLTAKMLRALQLAKREALRMESEEIATVHLILALLAMREGMAFEILGNLGATYDGVLEAILIGSHR